MDNTYNEQLKAAVWMKGYADSHYDPSIYRTDRYGLWMRYGDYGNRDSDYGWEIDHIVPVSRGGSDSLLNLQPLHWRNNAKKQDNLL